MKMKNKNKLNQKELSSLISLSKRLNNLTIRFGENDVALGNGETVSICLNQAADCLDTILQNFTEK